MITIYPLGATMCKKEHRKIKGGEEK